MSTRRFIGPSSLLSTACGCLLAMTCVGDLVEGPGTGSETTNGFVCVVRYQDGTPATGASVKIRTSEYLKDTSGGAAQKRGTAKIDAVTDSLGRFSVRGIEPDDYAIEVIDSSGSEGILLRARAHPDSVVDFGARFLDQLGSISGSLDSSGLPDTAAVYIQIYGIDRIEEARVSDGSFVIGGVACGSYTVRLLASTPSYLPDVVANVVVAPMEATVIDTVTFTPVSDWYCSKKVFLNTTASGADVAVTLKKFPVLLRLTSENFDFISARPSGADIRFVKSDNSPLPYSIERWDRVAGRAEIWVKVDTVFGNNGSQYFIMLWGNPDAASEANGAEVFDTAMGFAGVWHMNETDSATISDATGNRYNGRKYAMGSSAAQGMCGLAQRFDGMSQYIVLSNTASSKLNFAEDGSYSVSAWVYAEALDHDFHSIVSKGNQQYGLQIAKDDAWQFFEFRNRVGWESVESPAAAKSWKYVTGVRAGKKQYLYVDGDLVDSTIATASGVANRITTDNVFIGRRTLDTTRFWNGMIDEVRICGWSHSVNWIKLCYMNQKQEDELVEFR